jgi:FixJ family two-component response regulator
MSGLDVQTQLLKMRNDLAVIVVTGQGDIQTAVRAMKAGASDFLEKPYSDHALLGSIEMAFGKRTSPITIAIPTPPGGWGLSVRASGKSLTDC